jgi:hypothetical protein
MGAVNLHGFAVGIAFDDLTELWNLPPADVVNEQSRKAGLLVFNVQHQSVEILPTSDV